MDKIPRSILRSDGSASLTCQFSEGLEALQYKVQTLVSRLGYIRFVETINSSLDGGFWPYKR